MHTKQESRYALQDFNQRYTVTNQFAKYINKIIWNSIPLICLQKTYYLWQIDVSR